jgi:hypothetical protein
VQGVTDHYRLDLVLANKTGDGLQISAKVRSVQRKQRLRHHPKRIGDGQADALVTDIEREGA